MKKILSIAVASLAVAAVADSFSPNIGVTTLSLSLKNNVIPVQYTSLTNSSAVTADALVCTNNIEVGSHLYIFQDNSYTAWTLTANGWEAYDKSSTSDGIAAGIPATGQTLATGSAIWLSFKSKPQDPVLVSVYGAEATGITTTIAPGKSEAPVSTLVCNPKGSEKLDWLSAVTPSQGDKVQFLGSTFSGYYQYTISGWKKVSGTGISTETPGKLDAYQGLWYVSKGGTGTITW